MVYTEDLNKKLQLIKEEVLLCKCLSSNNLKIRNRGVSSLRKWINRIEKSDAVEAEDFIRIWNGIFYFLWMSDKPLVQEDAAERVSSLIHSIKNDKIAMLFVRGYFETMASNWDRISHHRTEKFLMFMRRFLRQALVMLAKSDWELEKVKLFSAEIYNAIQLLPLQLARHFNEIFNEEVAKISDGRIPTDALVALLNGFAECIIQLKPSMMIINDITTNVFGGLSRQLKVYLKQKAVLDVCAEENGMDDDDESNDKSDKENIIDDKALDPRPGRVNVYLPYIDFDEQKLVQFLTDCLNRSRHLNKAKNILIQLIEMFKGISKLRTSLSSPKYLSYEMNESTNRKRKKDKFSLAKIIKDSCRKLEKDEESLSKSEEQILKQLQSTGDLFQLPVGGKTRNVLVAKRTKKRSDTWDVTELEVNPHEESANESASDWTITELEADLDSKNTAVSEEDKKSKKAVVLDEMPVVQTFEQVEESEAKVDSINGDKIPVTLFDVKKRRKLLKNNVEYTLVDVRNSAIPDAQNEDADNSKVEKKPEILGPESSDWKSIPEQDTAMSINVGKIDNLIQHPKKRPLAKKKINDLSVRKQSERIAQIRKTKRKVEFTLEKNQFQDVKQYRKTLLSNPQIPFDSSKLPPKSVLKETGVSSPINPFYAIKLAKTKKKNKFL